MEGIRKLLANVPLPKMVKVRQKFDTAAISDVAGVVRGEIGKNGIGDRIREGMSVAVAVGSRGVNQIDAITRVTVEEIKKRGGKPFVVPSMGSHGGATAAGQEQVLAELGITEASVGCPIVSCMDVVEVGKLPNGLAVYIDKKAYEADGIVVINRVKPHTAFRGECESGLVKMLSIGLGNQIGADSCHAYSFSYMAENIIEMAKIKIALGRFLFGIGTIENAYDKVVKISAVPAEEMIETDKAMLVEAKEKMPRILFDQMDVLIVDQIGKEMSGDGMDPNITGRYPTNCASGGPAITKLVVLRLTEKTHGNANGMGAADFTTRKLFNQIDYESTYINALTSTIATPIRIPMILDSDKEALLAAVKTCNAFDLTQARIVRIPNTLHLGEIYISESMLAEAKLNPNLEILSQPASMEFDGEGNLF